MAFDRDQYNEFLASSPQGTLFCTTWWLDAVAPEGYYILTVQKDGNILAAWPIVFRHCRIGGLRIRMPSLTPWLGVLYHPPSSKLANQLSKEKRLSNELIEQLPEFGALDAKFHRNFGYWSPFYWRGFTQTTRYTYVLDDLSDPDTVWAGLRKNIRTDIRKAQKEGIAIEYLTDIEEFWRVHALTFERQGLAMPYSADFVQRVDSACQARGVRKIMVARDKTGDIHAAAYVVWDNRSVYYLMGGGDPEKRGSGATSLVVWEAIRLASGMGKAFDFEGSMIEPVERFFRAFGAKPYPYFHVSKVNSPLRFAYRAAQEAARLLRGAVRDEGVR